MAAEITPLHKRMETVVRELLGPNAAESEVQFAVLSIVSQCTGPIAARRSDIARSGAGRAPFSIEDTSKYADHVVKFSLAALSVLRKDIESSRSQEENPKTAFSGGAQLQ